MTRDEAIKTMALAMHASAAHSSFWSVDDLRVMAASALTAIEAAGLAIVPVEATDEMCGKAQKAWAPDVNHFKAHAIRYRAMIGAGKI